MNVMEKINQRDMKVFVLSSLINTGIGLVFGIVVGIFGAIMTGEASMILSLPLSCAVVFALLGVNMYRVYFYYRFSLDVNAVCEGDGKETESSLVAAVLSSLTLGLYNVYWLYKLGQRLKVNAPRYGFKMQETGKEIAVLSSLSFGYIAAWELIKNMNKIAKVYNQNGLAEVVGGVQ